MIELYNNILPHRLTTARPSAILCRINTPTGGGRGRQVDDTQRAAVLKRLRSIAGHVNGIERMIAEDAYCIDVIKQVQAVQAALNKVNDLILAGHLNSCVIEAVRGDDQKARERVLDEIVDVFEMAQKI